jgi:hypothetical protein
MRTSTALAIAALAASGCSGPGREEGLLPPAAGAAQTAAPTNAPPGGLIVTPDYSLTGRVAAVDLRSWFVVLDFSVTGMPAIGKRLTVLRSGREVAEVRVSGPQRDNKIVADIIHGNPRVGDVVREY